MNGRRRVVITGLGALTSLGLSAEEAATAILRVANATMAQALRLVSGARGHDPRRVALVALGGAGPMHACDIADELAHIDDLGGFRSSGHYPWGWALAGNTP